MDSIIAPAVIAAVVSMAGAFCKDIWFDRKNRQRETRILAIKISYILRKYVFKCAVQLTNTRLYLQTKDIDQQTGDDVYNDGDYNVEFVDIPLNMENINWENIDADIVSRINTLSLYIMSCDTNVTYQYERFGRAAADKEYIKRASIIGNEILGIIRMIENEYNLKHTDISLFDGTIDELFF